MQSGKIARVFLICLVLILSMAHCQRTTPEQQLRAAVSRMQSGIEARDAGAMKQLLADDFIGPGGMDRTNAGRMAQLLFLQHQDVGVNLGPLDIRWFPSPSAPDHATVHFTVVLTGGSGAMLPDAARVYQVETGWRRDGDTWLLTNASWSP